MSRKRDASLNLSDVDGKENKKPNLEDESNSTEGAGEMSAQHRALNSDMEKKVDDRTSHKQGTVSMDISELEKIKGDVRRLKSIAKSQCDEIREGITAITNKLGEMFIAHSATATSANFYGDFIEQISAKLTDAELREKARDKRMDTLELQNQKTLAKCIGIEKEVGENTQARKSCNLVLNGVPEKDGENCIATATSYIKHIDPNFIENHIVNAYRLGRKGGSAGKYRTLLVKFKDSAMKDEIVRKKTVLKNRKDLAKFHCNDDLAPSVRKARQEMREIVRYATKNGYPDARTTGNKLYIGDKTYYEDELYMLPAELQMSNIKTRPIGGGIGFQSEYSYLSNFFPCQIKMHQSVFSCSEQAFFYHKAIICEREDIAMKLKEMDDPAKIKYKGDRILTCEAWEKSKKDVMRKVLREKFTQNPELKAKLLGTSGLPLLECTNNKYWGTGWYLDDLDWNNSTNYPGKNVLGSLLEEIRESFDLDVLNSTEAIKHVSPMETEISSVEKTITPDAQMASNVEPVPSKKVPVLAEGKVTFSSVNMSKMNKPSAKEIAEGIKPAVLTERPVGGQPQAEAPVINATIMKESKGSASKGDATLMDEISDADNFDSVSFTSSIFSDGSDSFDAKNVTLPSGRLDVNKLMSWSLPPVNLSRVMERSTSRSPGTRNKIQRLMDAQKGDTRPDHSTPAAIISTCRKKVKKANTSVRSYFGDSSSLTEKESIRKMLQND